MHRTQLFCPPKVSRGKQYEHAIELVSNKVSFEYHVHGKDETCLGSFTLPEARKLNNCWEYDPDAEILAEV